MISMVKGYAMPPMTPGMEYGHMGRFNRAVFNEYYYADRRGYNRDAFTKVPALNGFGRRSMGQLADDPMPLSPARINPNMMRPANMVQGAGLGIGLVGAVGIAALLWWSFK